MQSLKEKNHYNHKIGIKKTLGGIDYTKCDERMDRQTGENLNAPDYRQPYQTQLLGLPGTWNGRWFNTRATLTPGSVVVH